MRKIIWSHRAEIKLLKILEFYAERNGYNSLNLKVVERWEAICAIKQSFTGKALENRVSCETILVGVMDA